MNEKIFLTSRLASQVNFCVHDDVVCEVRKTFQPFAYGASSLEMSLAARFCVLDWLFRRKEALSGRGELFISIFDPVEFDLCLGHYKVEYEMTQIPNVLSCIRIE